jgi:hypothetical protein
MAVRMWTGPTEHAQDPQPGEFEVTWEGAVLATGEHNGYDDSDFYAVVWDAEAGEPREIIYASTRGWTYNNSATVDATPEVLAAYDAWKAERAARNAAAAAAVEAQVPQVGKRVRVTKGRKVPAGTEGEVFWYGTDRYARHAQALWAFLDDGRTGRRVGIRTGDGEKYFTAATNVTVLVPEEVT